MEKNLATDAANEHLIGFRVPRVAVGCGLDFAGCYRNLLRVSVPCPHISRKFQKAFEK
jgi:hypoxanthine-guanine phosphoribosyltransferase